MEPARPRVVVVTRRWGEGEDEAGSTTRLIAGALARHAQVFVVHLDPALAGKPTPPPVRDSVFTVHQIPIYGGDRLRARLLEAALAAHDGGYRVPQLGAHVQQAMQGVAPDAPRLIESLRPDAILLAGSEQPYNLDVLGRPGEAGRARVVVMPMAGDVRYLRSAVVLRLFEHADAIATIHPGEQRALTQAGAVGPGWPPLGSPALGSPALGSLDLGPTALRGTRASGNRPPVVPIELGLVVHRGSADHRLFGVRSFGRYVVLLRRFPASGPRFQRSITHEVLREVVAPALVAAPLDAALSDAALSDAGLSEGGLSDAGLSEGGLSEGGPFEAGPSVAALSVAEVDGVRWRITDAGMTLDLPVGPSRVNLWRLFAHAHAVVDVRPPGPVGREAIEAMMLGVPSIVPANSAAKAHVEAGNGGLWYADHAELVNEVRALCDEDLRGALARSGEAYGRATHGRIDNFVARMADLVLGPERAADSVPARSARPVLR